MSEDRRHPLRPFDPSVIQSFLGGRDLKSVELLPAGKSNTNYKLVCTDGECCVLRLLASRNAARECYLLKRVRNVVPVPEVLECGEDWMLVSFCKGSHLAENPDCTQLAAEALSRIGLIKFDSPGWITADGSISPFEFGNEEGFVASILDDQNVQRWLGREATTVLARILRREADAQSGASEEACCLCHGDFNPTNILVYNGRISGILDWEFAHSGNVYMDLGNLLRHTPPERQEQIRSGFEVGGVTLPNDWKRRAEFIDVSSHLEFLTSRRSDEFKQRCVNWIYSFITRYRSW